MRGTIRRDESRGNLDSDHISLYTKYRLRLPRRTGFMDRWRIARFHPFRELADIEAEIGRAFDTYFGPRPRTAGAERTWSPAIDVYETHDDLVVAVELPGVRERDVRVTMTGDVLSVSGRRGTAAEAREESYHRIERWSGTFERAVKLPLPVQADRIRASYKDGVLEIRLPKLPAPRPREIKVEVG
jgi:HSP20 family protein